MKTQFANIYLKHVKLLLFIVPAIYMFLGFYFNRLTGIYFIRSVDSEYIYFISGLSLARGQFMIGHIDNPASPLQYIVALVFKALYLIRRPENGIIEDAIQNSELYLKVANLVLITLTSAFLYVMGRVTYKLTNMVSLSILIQSTPFITELSIDNLSRFAPEAFLILPVILMMYFVIRALNDENPNYQNQALWAGLIAGFGLSIKLTFFPLWLLPLFVLKKKHLVYVATAIVSFFAIALPVTLQISRFWHWIKRLLFFSGQHGEGEKSLIDWNTFWPNITEIYNANKFYFRVTMVFFVLFVVYLFFKKKDKYLVKIAGGVLLVIFLLLFLVGKHFEYRYFIMALYLFPLMVFLAIRMLDTMISFKNIAYMFKIIFVVVAGLLVSKQISVIPIKSFHISNDVNTKTETYQFASTLPKDAMKIVASSYYGGAYKEYALMFTGAYAGKQNEVYKPVLARLYPNTYIYHSWDRSMNFWDNPLEITVNTPPFYVYIHSGAIEIQLFEDIRKFTAQGLELTKEIIYHNEKSDESLLKVSVKEAVVSVSGEK